MKGGFVGACSTLRPRAHACGELEWTCLTTKCSPACKCLYRTSLAAPWMRARLTIVALALGAFTAVICVRPAAAQQEEDEECMMCHDDRSLTAERNGRTISMFVDYRRFALSVHGKEGCISCHSDVDVDDLPHEDNLDKVECDMCHDDASEAFVGSLHGTALEQNRFLAPSCVTCHGKHNMLSSRNENSPTYVMNIPNLCGNCHKEGTRVSELRTVSQRHILENYSQSIHGDGLFRRGLTVTAVCTSCHRAHEILPHEDRRSSIHRANIAATCMSCHAQIERVHVKVIDGRLWEKAPHQLPNCVDCHQPHKVRRVFYTEGFPDSKCMSCHSDPDIHKIEDGERISLFVDAEEIAGSAHVGNNCYKCHTNVSWSEDPICLDSGPVDCAMCHSEAVQEFQTSMHGQQYARGNEIAPYCTDCHGSHDTMKRTDLESPTFARNIPDLCGRCHREGEEAAVAYTGTEREIIDNYTMSIHGKGLLQSGLMVTATCIDCHTAHRELPISDTLSTVHPENIASTCGNCHLGIFEEFKHSVHSPLVTTSTEGKLPVCNDCHLSHEIKRVDVGDFRQQILDQCGNCHLDVTETYFETFHGKVSKLGAIQTARCYDCHGAHDILPTSNPESRLSRANVVETCKSCHPNSNRKFVGYLTHATHHNKDKYPYLYYTYVAMTTLLVSVFGIFGIHTLLWMPRALAERRKNRKANGKTNGSGQTE